MVGLLVSIMSALIPEIIKSFSLSYGLASLLPFSFYIAITLACIPAGLAGEKYSSKSILIFAFLFALAGIFVFVSLLSFQASIISLFIIGIAVAITQVTSVPLVRKVCGAENLAFHSTLNQLMYGGGAFLSPMIYSFLTKSMLSEGNNPLKNIFSRFVPQGFEWTSAYWLFIVLLIILVLIISVVKFPEKNNDTIPDPAKGGVYLELFRNKYVILYFISLAAYASCEQGIAAWMSQFFKDYHGLNPQTEGASVLSFYWLLLTAGCFGGMMLLKIFDSRKVLAGLTIAAIVSLGVGIYGGTNYSKIAFPLVAACESVMWPVILSLALNSVRRHHEILSGLMFTASIGGAIGPFIIGNLGDIFGLRISLNYLFLAFLIVLSVAFWSKPLINNKTISD